MSPRVSLLASGAFVLAALAVTPLHAQPDRCGRVDVAGSPVKGISSRKGETVATATQVEDLVFQVKLKKTITGDHTVTLRFYLPEGDLYQAVSTPVSLATHGKSKESGRSRRLDGYPFPLTVVGSTPIATGSDSDKQTVALSLPVAGTAIVSNSLYGEWAVDLYLDDAAQPCAARTKFRIQP